MRPISLIALFALAPVAAWGFIAESAVAVQPEFSTVPAATPAFMQPAASVAVAVVPPTAPLLGVTMHTSVLPPGAPDGPGTDFCSVSPFGTQGSCSALTADEVCSTYLFFDGNCSSIGATGNVCSAHATDSTCSVLPPNSGANNNAFCSAMSTTTHGATTCSAVGLADNQRCTTKGLLTFQNVCSVWGLEADHCSVLNTGAATNSYCSVKTGQPAAAEFCSVIQSSQGSCSVILGGNGVCTTFGQAAPGSCSNLSGGVVCSIIGGAAGDPCTQ